jgi:putative FmdB family regulatory protein
MPIYEYRCASCGHELEALQKLSDAPLAECPACHKPELKKLLSAAGFQLKGSGWYVTDFRGGNKPAAKDKDKDKVAKGDAAAGGNGSAAAGDSSSTEGKKESAAGEPKATERATAGTTTEPKPAAKTTSTSKSDS